MPGQIIAPGRNSAPRKINPAHPQQLVLVSAETLIKNYVSPTDQMVPNKIELYPGTREYWMLNREQGRFIAVLMNAPAVTRDNLSKQMLQEFVNNLNVKTGYALDGIFWCPHDPEHENPILSKCQCRLPFYYGLMVQANIFFENAFSLSFPMALQSLVGGEEYKALADRGNYNYMSTDEVQTEAMKMQLTAGL